MFSPHQPHQVPTTVHGSVPATHRPQTRADSLFAFNVEARRLLSTLKSELINNEPTHFLPIFNEFDRQTTLASQSLTSLQQSEITADDDDERLQIAYAAYFCAEKSYVKRDILSARRYAQRALLIFLSIHGPIVKEQDDLALVFKDANVDAVGESDWLAVPTVKRYAIKGQLWESIIDCYLLCGSIEHNCQSFSLAHDHFENAYLFAKKSDYQCQHLVSLCLCRIENNLKHIHDYQSIKLDLWRTRFASKTLAAVIPARLSVNNNTHVSTHVIDIASAITIPITSDTQTSSSSSHSSVSSAATNTIDNDGSESGDCEDNSSDGRSGGTSTRKRYDCHVCGRTYSHLSSLRSHAILHSDAAYSCDECGKKFTHQRKLEVHMRRHSGQRPFECDICHKRYADKCSLVRHYRIHTNERPFNCEHCPKLFADSTALITHTRRHHTDERPFVCAICGKSFVSGTDLNNHSPTHSTLRPYECTLCGTKFKRKGDRTKHAKKKHPNVTS